MPNQYERIAALDNEIEARALEAQLTDLNIPHVLHSYYDIAYDGIFQLSQGWGHLEAPPECKNEILEILSSIRKNSSESMDKSV